jgi:O-antigen/teichoic acid export membrane protein
VSHEESSHRQLFRQSSHYSTVSLLAMVAGLVSFPVLTRVFTVGDYGTMNLISVTLTVCVAIGKLGIQQSIVRYHTEISAGKSKFTLSQLYSTTVLAMAGASVVMVLLLLAGAELMLPLLKAPSRLLALLALSSLLIIVQVTESAFVNFLRAAQATVTFMKYYVAKKYLSLALILGSVLLIASTLPVYYAASVTAEATAIGALAAIMLRRDPLMRPRRAEFSKPLYYELLKYGIPMMFGVELSSIVLSVGDRYVIGGMIGDVPLGLYAGAYNLCQYVQAIVITSVGQAVMPLYLSTWDRHGAEKTSDFIGRSLRAYAIVGAAVVAGVAAVGPVLLPALASEKYESAGSVIPWVIGGMVVDGATTMLGAGLFIQRKTRTIMAAVISCAILNVALNVVLIPVWSIVGSAIATLVSYSAGAVAMAVAARGALRVPIPWATMTRAGLAAAVMYGMLAHVQVGGRWLTVGTRVALGAVIYGVIMVLIDSTARGMGREILASLARRVKGIWP